MKTSERTIINGQQDKAYRSSRVKILVKSIKKTPVELKLLYTLMLLMALRLFVIVSILFHQF